MLLEVHLQVDADLHEKENHEHPDWLAQRHAGHAPEVGSDPFQVRPLRPERLDVRIPARRLPIRDPVRSLREPNSLFAIRIR